MNRALIFLAGLFFVPGLKAELKPAPVFGDHMVLQREARVPIWGRSAPGAEVAVDFAGQHKKTKAGSDGRWRVDLDPMPANAVGGCLTVSSGHQKSEKFRQVFDDVLVGEVWLCSGQSNMAWTVRENGVSVANAAMEEAAAEYPLIRQLRIPKTNARQPVDDFQAEWTVCSPETVGGFSGVAYFFAREIFQKLNVPVGIITTAYGGTPIEAWLSGETFASAPACVRARQRFAETEKNWPEIVAAYRAEKDAWTKESEAAKAAGTKPEKPLPRQPVGPGHPYSPVTVYNAMLYPLIPCAMRGAIWYQGEGNVTRAEDYEGLFAALIRQWRKEWGQGDFPFYFVQLANFQGAEPSIPDWAWLREAQSRALALPNTAMAVAIDVGNPKDIHPRNKQDVGHRLALLALGKTYGKDVGAVTGPLMQRSQRVGRGMEVVFAAGTELVLREPASGFEVAGADRKFHPASAEVRGGAVFVSAPSVAEPVAVRYAWANSPVASLFDSRGLPAPPFRTDDWPREAISRP